MIAEALRKSILQAAIQGKLTEQLPEDGDAYNLLNYILIPQNRKKFEQTPELFLIGEDEEPFSIPDNWVWVRLGDICIKVGSGSTPAGGRAVYLSEGIKFIRSQNVYNDGLRLDNVAFISPEIDRTKSGSHVFAKDILLNITGASIGRCALVPDDFDVANINQHVLILRLSYENIRKYLHLVMTSPYIYGEIMGAQVGGTKEGLSATKAKQLFIPLPPISEQIRILDIVNEALEKIKEHEKDEIKLDLLQKSFPKKMKDSLLQAAIQGKLTEQMEADGDARELVADIQKEKERLLKEGKIKKEKALPEITEEEIPFEIPENWCWVRLPEIGELARGKSKHRPRNDNILYENGCYPMVQTGDVAQAKRYITTFMTCYNEIGLAQSRLWKKGTLCLTIAANIGDVAILTFDACFPDSIVGFNAFLPINSNEYFLYMLSAYKHYLDNLSRSTAQKNINLEILASIPIPLPPLAEQQRIVERLEQLLPLCDALE
jgi:type I restriction enzyme S subunit